MACKEVGTGGLHVNNGPVFENSVADIYALLGVLAWVKDEGRPHSRAEGRYQKDRNLRKVNEKQDRTLGKRTGVRYGISDFGTGACEERLCGGRGFGAREAGRDAPKGVGAFGGVAFVYIAEWPGLHGK